MGKQSRTNPGSQSGRPWLAVLLWLVSFGAAWGQASTPLLLPGGLAYDAAGNLYFAESGNQVVRRLGVDGSLTVVAGTGVQGYSGDGGAATLASLDSPGAIALDAAGNLLIADTHNHRIRRVSAATGLISTFVGTGVAGSSADGLAAGLTLIDLPTALAVNSSGDVFYADGRQQVVRRVDHATGLVTTVAGNGVQGSQGDGGPAVVASLDSPAGLAVDGAGNSLVSDSHNQRVRRIDAGTGIITTVAGNGIAGFAAGAGTASRLSLPRGLAVDAAGTLYIVDAGNQRIRRVDAVSGAITTLAGSATQDFTGDGGQATQAALASPRGVALNAAGLPTLTDAGNGRVRQVDGAGIIRTIAGVGATAAAGLQLVGPTRVSYGTGIVTATLGGAAGSGSVRLLDGPAVIATAIFSSNLATFSLGTLNVGTHQLQASFAGDPSHPVLSSNVLQVVIVPAGVLATPNALAVVYGTAIPGLTGTLSGVLAQDVGHLLVSYSSFATALSGVGTYPITAALSGSAAGNYILTTAPAAVTVSKAPSSLALSGTLLAHLASGTSGQPGGLVSLLDGNSVAASLIAGATGDVQFSSGGLSNGSHTLSASYPGDANFLGSTAPPVVITIGPAAGADFSIASVGASAVTIAAGNDAVFSFAMTPVNGSLSSPIVLQATGLPSGATASFSPAYLPPGSGPAGFTMTVHTIKLAGLRTMAPLLLAGLLAMIRVPRRRRRGVFVCLLVGLAGCGDRVNSAGQQGAASRTFNLTVTATATSSSGVALVHSVPVTLTLQ